MDLLTLVSSQFCKVEHPQTIRTQVNTDLHLLVQVLAWFDQFDTFTLPRSVWLQCRLALAEGFTNAVRHAHRGKPAETPIEIEVTFKDSAIELRIWDCGSGFDLEKRLNTLPNSVDLEHAGGRGLKIIQQTADRLSYTTVDEQRNCLLIIKNFPSKHQAAFEFD